MIKVNGKELDGTVSVQESLEHSKNLVIRKVEGYLKTAVCGLDKITTIECDKFSLSGIKVTAKSLGSEDDNVVYGFTAETLTIRPEGYING